MASNSISLFISTECLWNHISKGTTFSKVILNPNHKKDFSIYCDITYAEIKDRNQVPQYRQDSYRRLRSSVDININPGSEVFDKIRKKEYNVFRSFPYSIFVLDVNKDEANLINQEYGVTCIPESEDPISSLVFRKSIRCIKDSGNHSWNDFSDLTQENNSLIFINDRYLLSNNHYLDKFGKSHRFADGYKNLSDYIDRCVNMRSCGKVIIMFEITASYARKWRGDKNDHKAKFQYIANDICNEIKRKRPKMTVCCIGFVNNKDYKDNIDGYEYTHNRIIASNSFIMTFDHKIAAFDQFNKSNSDQDIRCNCAFSDGIDNSSDLPLFSMNNFFQRMNYILQNPDNQEKIFAYEVTDNNDAVRFIDSNKVMNLFGTSSQ